MTDKIPNLRIITVTEEHADDWTEIFLLGIKSCRWMRKYFARQNISEYDVKLSLLQDLKTKSEDEILLIAYDGEYPIGIIRFDSYYIPGASKIISHFPLIHPRYQKKGVGRALVKKGSILAMDKGNKDIWSECWALNKREISNYQQFYEKIGFESKSFRLEMSCNVYSFDEKKCETREDIEILISNEITDDFVELISKSYSDSSDILHTIEDLGNTKIANAFLNRTKKTFEALGFRVDCVIAKYRGNLSAGLLTATAKNKGMILEIGVLPNYRGKRIAWHLISKYIVKMKKQKIGEVVLGVDENNFPAVNLYRKLGFNQSWFGHLLLLVDKAKLGLNND